MNRRVPRATGQRQARLGSSHLTARGRRERGELSVFVSALRRCAAIAVARNHGRSSKERDLRKRGWSTGRRAPCCGDGAGSDELDPGDLDRRSPLFAKQRGFHVKRSGPGQAMRPRTRCRPEVSYVEPKTRAEDERSMALLRGGRQHVRAEDPRRSRAKHGAASGRQAARARRRSAPITSEAWRCSGTAASCIVPKIRADHERRRGRGSAASRTAAECVRCRKRS